MPEINLETLKSDLDRDEDTVLLPYEDSVGKITIGTGRNLSDCGISREEALFLLENDIKKVLSDLDRAFPWWREKPEPVQRFLANLCFNLGIVGLRKWRETLRFIEAGQYKAAAKQFRSNTRYFSQVHSRAERLARLLESVV
jgi:lysozyme